MSTIYVYRHGLDALGYSFDKNASSYDTNPIAVTTADEFVDAIQPFYIQRYGLLFDTSPDGLILNTSRGNAWVNTSKNMLDELWMDLAIKIIDTGAIPFSRAELMKALNAKFVSPYAVAGFAPFNWKHAYRYLLAHDPLECYRRRPWLYSLYENEYNTDAPTVLKIVAQNPWIGAPTMPIGFMSAFTSAMESLHPGFLVLFREALEHYHGVIEKDDGVLGLFSDDPEPEDDVDYVDPYIDWYNSQF